MSTNTEPKYIIVAGASAGGMSSINELTAQLTREIDAALFIVLHFRKLFSEAHLIQHLQDNTSFTCKMAEDGETIRKGFVYMAIPDKHLILKEGKIVLGHGPQENHWRPSIDVLFRSAAASYDGRVIGVILSGLMNDGTSGMIAIKKCGGICIVQDPDEAEYPDMILSVLDNVEVDYCVPVEAMGAILLEKTKNDRKMHDIPYDVKAEAKIAERMAIGIDNVKEIGEKSLFSCPDCGGGLWEMVSDSVVRYRCHTGHVYVEDELLIRQSDALENTLWTALRIMEERKNLLNKMGKEEESKGLSLIAVQKKERSMELQAHIDRLKEILFESKKD